MDFLMANLDQSVIFYNLLKPNTTKFQIQHFNTRGRPIHFLFNNNWHLFIIIKMNLKMSQYVVKQSLGRAMVYYDLDSTKLRTQTSLAFEEIKSYKKP